MPACRPCQLLLHVHVLVSGPEVLLGMGNGDPQDHTLEGRNGSSIRQTFGGLLRVLIQTIAGRGGSIVVTATAVGLNSSFVTVTANTNCTSA